MNKFLLLAAALLPALPATAAINVAVAGTSMPWDWRAGGINDAFQFGIKDGTGPVVVSFASAGITAGGPWAVIEKGGLTSAYGGVPTVDNNGYQGSVFKDGVLGSTGTYFPSNYTPSYWDADPLAGVFLEALIFTFTDDSGAIIGSPYATNIYPDGLGGYNFTGGIVGAATPAGATRIQLGLNDDLFADNTGSLTICVGSSYAACFPSPGVPEPAAWALMLGGFGLVGAAVRLRRAGYAAA